MIVYYHNLLALVSKQLLKNHCSRLYMHFMVFCMLQKVNARVALCIINKSGLDHPLATVKTFYFRQQILQGEQICVTDFSYFSSFYSFFLEFPSLDECNIFLFHSITHVMGVSFQRLVRYAKVRNLCRTVMYSVLAEKSQRLTCFCQTMSCGRQQDRNMMEAAQHPQTYLSWVSKARHHFFFKLWQTNVLLAVS